MFELLLVAIALIGSFAAGIYDLKTTNIPDKVCIAMIILGIIIHALNGFLTNDFTILLNSLFFAGIFLIIGLVMYYAGWWGGGDGELLIAVGILLPTLFFVKTQFPFAISFFINTWFIGAIYSVIYVIILAYKDKGIGKSFFDRIGILLTKGYYRKISVRKLKPDDMIGENIPRLKIYKRFIRGLTKKEVIKIKKIRKYVIIKEGIRYGIVFPLTLLFTLLFGDFLFLFF
jgi:Flp pilus assembly protein protease CpaA